MKHDPITPGKRKSVNLSLDTGIVAAAREQGINLSRVAEDALRVAIKAERERRWIDENWDAIQSSNEWFEKNGLPYAELRLW